MSHEHHAVDWAARVDELEREAELGLPWITEAMGWLADRASPQTVIDLGSGPGVATCVLASRWPSARVIAVDESADLLARVDQRAHRLEVADRIQTQQADAVNELSTLPAVDLIWASRVLHHVPDVQQALGKLAGRLTANGVLALVEGGLPSRFLPDDPGVGTAGLFSRLDAESPHLHAERMGHRHDPVRTSLDWPILMQRAGLTHLGTRSFLLDLTAPVDDGVRDHAMLRLGRTREQRADELSSDDRAALDRLLDPNDELGIRRRPDLFWLSAYTVHCAQQAPSTQK